jgi:hypothetical protein
MKTLEKDELYQNLRGFLTTKGVELKDGSYAQKIQKSCALLSDAINTGQEGLSRAKVEIDKKLDQLRQVIHEKTAARGTRTGAPRREPPPARETGSAKSSRKRTRPHKRTKPRK